MMGLAFPCLEILQLETSTACNMNCHYCDYHHDSCVAYNYQMPLPLVEKIVSQLEECETVRRVQPWLAGEPLLEPRMPEIVEIVRKYCRDAEIVFFTNATVYEKRDMLMLADQVEVTVSAATPETYMRVHGKPYLDRVVKTVEWLEAQPNHPEIHLRIVLTERNLHELEAWRRQWSRFERFENVATGLLANKWRPAAGLELNSEVKQVREGRFSQQGRAPCLFWNLAAVNVFGDLYQCCSAVNNIHGNLNRMSFEEAWRRRVASGRNTETCRVCPVRVY